MKNCYCALGPLDNTACYLCSDEVAKLNDDKTQLIPLEHDTMKCFNDNCGAFIHRKCLVNYAISLLRYSTFDPNEYIPSFSCFFKTYNM